MSNRDPREVERIKAEARAFALGNAPGDCSLPPPRKRSRRGQPVEYEPLPTLEALLTTEDDDDDDDFDELPDFNKLDEDDDDDIEDFLKSILADPDELEQELGWLAQDDVENALDTLQDEQAPPASLRNPTREQEEDLRKLIWQHTQLLWQQAILLREKNPKEKNSAVTLLEELESHWKDAQLRQGPRHTRRSVVQPLAQSVFDIPSIRNCARSWQLFCDGNEVPIWSKWENQRDRDVIIGTTRKVLKTVGAHYDKELFPTAKDPSKLILEPKLDHLDMVSQYQVVRKHRNWFTDAEDNLVLRGVNVYGEKQWMLLAERYLPDRSVHVISQRYAKLCSMLYESKGIKILNDTGNEPCFETPPKLDSVDDVDETKAKDLKKISAPAVLNVHRWSLAEDLTILKAVPIYGTMWAEIAARYLPHRDRGHIRKRYLVLERRVKSVLTKEKRSPIKLPISPRAQPVRKLSFKAGDGTMMAFNLPVRKSYKTKKRIRLPPPNTSALSPPKAKKPPVGSPKPPTRVSRRLPGSNISLHPLYPNTSEDPPMKSSPEQSSRAAFEHMLSHSLSRLPTDSKLPDSPVKMPALPADLPETSLSGPSAKEFSSQEDGYGGSMLDSFRNEPLRKSSNDGLSRLSAVALLEMGGSNMTAPGTTNAPSLSCFTSPQSKSLLRRLQEDDDSKSSMLSAAGYVNETSNLAGTTIMGNMFDTNIERHDIQAVSALNQLSNSPSKDKAVKKDINIEDEDTDKKPSPAKKESLFSKVVGSKRKLGSK